MSAIRRLKNVKPIAPKEDIQNDSSVDTKENVKCETYEFLPSNVEQTENVPSDDVFTWMKSIETNDTLVDKIEIVRRMDPLSTSLIDEKTTERKILCSVFRSYGKFLCIQKPYWESKKQAIFELIWSTFTNMHHVENTKVTYGKHKQVCLNIACRGHFYHAIRHFKSKTKLNKMWKNYWN